MARQYSSVICVSARIHWIIRILHSTAFIVRHIHQAPKLQLRRVNKLNFRIVAKLQKKNTIMMLSWALWDMCDFMAIISTILSQMWTIYIHTHALTGTHRDTDRIWKTGVRFDFYHIYYCLIEFKFSTGFISFQLVDVFACMFWNAFHTWCECKRKEMTLHTRFGDDEKIKREKTNRRSAYTVWPRSNRRFC